MRRPLLMAIDLGTSFIKSGVYGEDGVPVAQSSCPVRDERPAPGVFIQRGEALFESVIRTIRDAVQQLGERAGSVAAIAFTGQMAGCMGVSKDWEDLTTWSCSLDSRYMPYAYRQMESLKDRFLEISGTNFPQMAPKAAWMRGEFPEQAQRTEKYLMISGYVIGRLSRMPVAEAVLDRSYASWTGLADIRRDAWCPEILGAVGLEERLLPRIVNCNEVFAALSDEMARETGLPSGIPLVAGAGDKVAGCLGAGVVTPGEMILEASSYGEISCCVDEYRPDMEERRYDVLASAVPGQFFVTHFAAGSGIALDWFVNNFARQPGDVDTAAGHRRMDALAQEIPAGCEGLMGIGLLCGSSMPSDAAIKGMFMGFDLSHGAGHFYRALLESYAYDFAIVTERFKRFYPEYALDRVKLIGGGAKSATWPQMFADVDGRTYATLNRNDFAMWGACILAGNAIGLYGDLAETAKRFVAERAAFQPNASLRGAYDRRKRLYKAYLTELRGFYERIARIDEQ